MAVRSSRRFSTFFRISSRCSRCLSSFARSAADPAMPASPTMSAMVVGFSLASSSALRFAVFPAFSSALRFSFASQAACVGKRR